LGDLDMNHASASFKKGSIIGLKSLNLELSYLGQDGLWIGKRERSANLDIHLFYTYDNFQLHGYRTIIDQKIGSNKMYPAPELNSISEINDKLSETAFVLENPYLDLGFRYEKAEVDTLERKQLTYLLSKKLETTDHYLHTSAEYFQNKSENTETKRITFDHHSKVSILEWNNKVFYQQENNYFAATEFLISPVSGFSILAVFEEFGKESILPLWQEKRLAGGFLWQNRYFDLKLISGKDKIDSEDEIFIQSDLKVKLNLGRFSLVPSNWFIYRDTENIQLPSMQSQTDVDLIYNLNYDNALKFSLHHVFVSEYGYFTDFSEGYIINSFENLNCSLGFQITKNFSIKIDAVNILGSQQLFGYPTSEIMEGRHFNFNLHWIFIN